MTIEQATIGRPKCKDCGIDGTMCLYPDCMPRAMNEMPPLPRLPFAVFDEFGKPADDRVQDYGEACAQAAREAEREERMRGYKTAGRLNAGPDGEGGRGEPPAFVVPHETYSVSVFGKRDGKFFESNSIPVEPGETLTIVPTGKP